MDFLQLRLGTLPFSFLVVSLFNFQFFPRVFHTHCKFFHFFVFVKPYRPWGGGLGVHVPHVQGGGDWKGFSSGGGTGVLLSASDSVSVDETSDAEGDGDQNLSVTSDPLADLWIISSSELILPVLWCDDKWIRF